MELHSGHVGAVVELGNARAEIARLKAENDVLRTSLEAEQREKLQRVDRMEKELADVRKAHERKAREVDLMFDRAEAAERERDEARDLYTETEERLRHALIQLHLTERERDDNRAGWVAAIGERNAAYETIRELCALCERLTGALADHCKAARQSGYPNERDECLVREARDVRAKRGANT